MPTIEEHRVLGLNIQWFRDIRLSRINSRLLIQLVILINYSRIFVTRTNLPKLDNSKEQPTT